PRGPRNDRLAGLVGPRPADAAGPAAPAHPGARASLHPLGGCCRRDPDARRARRAGDRRRGRLRRGARRAPEPGNDVRRAPRGPGDGDERLGGMRAADAQGKVGRVWVDETRPVMQGSRLTAWECVREGIPHTLIADVVAASLMARGEVDLIVTGADRIAANGDTANKIGTYSLAVLARHHRVPFYVAAPFSTIDPALPSGEHIPIEERDPAEVRRVGGQQTAPAESPVFNPAFDVTSAALITAIITERGVFRPPYHFA